MKLSFSAFVKSCHEWAAKNHQYSIVVTPQWAAGPKMDGLVQGMARKAPWIYSVIEWIVQRTWGWTNKLSVEIKKKLNLKTPGAPREYSVVFEITKPKDKDALGQVLKDCKKEFDQNYKQFGNGVKEQSKVMQNDVR
jgi:hypothetical protein